MKLDVTGNCGIILIIPPWKHFDILKECVLSLLTTLLCLMIENKHFYLKAMQWAASEA